MKISLKEKSFYSKEFIKKLDNIIEEDGYIYRIIISSGSCYEDGIDESITISSHIAHIASDYQEDEGLELVLANGYVKDKQVVAELLMRKAVDLKNETYSD